MNVIFLLLKALLLILFLIIIITLFEKKTFITLLQYATKIFLHLIEKQEKKFGPSLARLS